MKRAMKLLSILLLIFVLTSCATSVTVRHLVPAEVDLSATRSLAVASTTQFKFPFGHPVPSWISGLQETKFSISSGYDANLAESVAEAASRMIFDAAQDTNGYFTIRGPEVTDAYLTLARMGENINELLLSRGVQALMTSSITYMDLDEEVVGRDVKSYVTEHQNPLDPASPMISYYKVTAREYFLVQKATLTLTYTIYDLVDNRILASRSFTGKEEKETKIGVRTYDSIQTTDTNGNPAIQTIYRDERRYTAGRGPSFQPLFEKILKSFSSTISKQLAPSWETTTLNLMSNKPKLKIAKDAYTLVQQGMYEPAYSRFLSLFQSTGHIPSGYNAALLLEAMGRLDEAVDLMARVYNQSGSRQVYAMLSRMQQMKSQHEKAQRQISGESVHDGQGVTLLQLLESL